MTCLGCRFFDGNYCLNANYGKIENDMIKPKVVNATDEACVYRIKSDIEITVF